MKSTFYCLLIISLLTSCKKNTDQEIDIREEILMEVNELRLQGCNCGAEYMAPTRPLTLNPSLSKAANSHAHDMYFNNYFEHISPSGTSPIQRAEKAGYIGQYVGENIGKGYASVSEVIAAWKNSESHCKAMMDSLYDEMGAAYYKKYWVIEFGQSLHK